MSAIYRFFGSILQFLDKITGNYMIALALFALIIQILMLPLAIKQQKNSIKQASLAPKVAALRKWQRMQEYTARFPWNAGWAVAREHAWRVFAIKLTAGITKSVLTDRYSMHRRFAYEY